ncbi:MAG: peptidoglycan-associated lipoprotein Pal [Acidobacteriota bacterium]
MKKPCSFRSILLAGLTSAVLASCSHPQPVCAPGVWPGARAAGKPVPAPPEQTVTVQEEPKIAPAKAPEREVTAGGLPLELAEINRAGYLKDVFFDTDRSELREDAREALAANVAWLLAHPTIKVLIEGHCDERHTTEYNLALGWRRANAAKSYMVSLGISAQRLLTLSYGEERPFAVGHDESAWWQNRRAHLVVTAR